MQNTSSDPPPAANQRCKPAAKLYICPAGTDPSQVESLIEIPGPLAKVLSDFFENVKEGRGFADLHLCTSPRRNSQKYQIRWKTAISQQAYFDGSTLDTIVSLFSKVTSFRDGGRAPLNPRHHDLVE